MQIQKRYRGEQSWEDVTEEEARAKLSDVFVNFDDIFAELRDGYIVYTCFTAWRKAPNEENGND